MEAKRSAEVILKEIEDAFAALAEIDTTTLTEGEVADAVVRSQRIRSMADAACQRTAGALDVSKAWQVDGARSPVQWITHRCKVPSSRAPGCGVCLASPARADAQHGGSTVDRGHHRGSRPPDGVHAADEPGGLRRRRRGAVPQVRPRSRTRSSR